MSPEHAKPSSRTRSGRGVSTAARAPRRLSGDLGGTVMGAAHPVEAPGHKLKFIPSPSCRGRSSAAQGTPRYPSDDRHAIGPVQPATVPVCAIEDTRTFRLRSLRFPFLHAVT
jgi:hypothetical protein